MPWWQGPTYHEYNQIIAVDKVWANACVPELKMTVLLSGMIQSLVRHKAQKIDHLWSKWSFIQGVFVCHPYLQGQTIHLYSTSYIAQWGRSVQNWLKMPSFYMAMLQQLHTDTCMRTHPHTPYTPTHMHAHTPTHAHARAQTCTHTPTHPPMHECVHTHMPTHTHTHAYAHTHTHAHTCTCTHTHHTRTRRLRLWLCGYEVLWQSPSPDISPYAYDSLPPLISVHMPTIWFPEWSNTALEIIFKQRGHFKSRLKWGDMD